MATQEELVSRLRKFRRNSRVVVYRTTTPPAGADFFVQKLGGPSGETNGVAITDLKTTFSIERDLSKHPNRCDIELYNLAPNTRAAIEKTKPLSVEFSAGHDGVNRLLFAGDVLHAHSRQEGPNRITTLQVGDGARAVARARVSRTYKRGTTIKTMLRDIARSMGQTLPPNIENSPDLNEQLASGTSLTGPARDEMTRTLAPFGYGWSFQNGHIQILRDGDRRNDEFLIDESVGMLDSPKFGQPTKSGKAANLDVRCLLYPELIPGGVARVNSLDIKGLFKIIKVRHSGDSKGDDWFTDVELKPL